MGKFVSNPVLDNRAKVLVVDLAALDTGGGILSVLNPEGVECLITEVIIQVDTVATAACAIDVGVAANGTTSNAALLNDLDVHSATGRFDNISDKGNGGRDVPWGSGQYITGSKASGAAAGLVGQAIIHYKV